MCSLAFPFSWHQGWSRLSLPLHQMQNLPWCPSHQPKIYFSFWRSVVSLSAKCPDFEEQVDTTDTSTLMTMEMMAMVICRKIISSSSSELQIAVTWGWAREEPKKEISSQYNFQDDGYISSTSAVHIQSQEGSIPTSNIAQNRELGVKRWKLLNKTKILRPKRK